MNLNCQTTIGLSDTETQYVFKERQTSIPLTHCGSINTADFCLFIFKVR